MHFRRSAGGMVCPPPGQCSAALLCFDEYAGRAPELDARVESPEFVKEVELAAGAGAALVSLNFNCSLMHDCGLDLPRQDAHPYVDPRETQPLCYRWLLVFRCPETLPADPGAIAKTYF